MKIEDTDGVETSWTKFENNILAAADGACGKRKVLKKKDNQIKLCDLIPMN